MIASETVRRDLPGLVVDDDQTTVLVVIEGSTKPITGVELPRAPMERSVAATSASTFWDRPHRYGRIVRIFKFVSGETAQVVADHGSHGFRIVPMARSEQTFVACIRLTAGGVIGRHEASGRQVFAVVDGDAVVSGTDGVEEGVLPGAAAIWEEGEMHQTRSVSGLTAILIEGDITTIA